MVLSIIAFLCIVLIIIIVQVFILDKRREFNICLSADIYRLDDIISTGKYGTTSMVLATRQDGNISILTCFPVLRSSNIKRIKLSYKIRNLFSSAFNK